MIARCSPLFPPVYCTIGIQWPNKCVCCGDRAIVKCSAVGKGFGSWYTLFGVNEYEEYRRERVVVEYSVCRKHFFWSLGINVACLFFYGGMFFSFCYLLFILTFDTLGIYILRGLILPSSFAIVLVLAIILQPVRIRWVRKDSYTMMIRNEDYAREFAMLNNLSPIG